MSETKRKDFLDVSKIIASIALPVIGLAATCMYRAAQDREHVRDQTAEQLRTLESQHQHDRDQQLERFKTIEALAPQLTDPDPKRQALALLLFEAIVDQGDASEKLLLQKITAKLVGSPYGGEQVAAALPVKKLAELTKSADVQVSSRAQNALGDIQAGPRQKEIADATPHASSGYVYMGQWDRTSQSWIKYYFELDGGPPPAPGDLSQKQLTVRQRTGAVYVRTDFPDADGNNRPVKGVLHEHEKVKVERAPLWNDGVTDSGFIWAQVKSQS